MIKSDLKNICLNTALIYEGNFPQISPELLSNSVAKSLEPYHDVAWTFYYIDS